MTEELKKKVEGCGIAVHKIEKDLGMGAGTLAKALKGKRDLPAKWEAPLEEYIKNIGKEPPAKVKEQGPVVESVPTVFGKMEAVASESGGLQEPFVHDPAAAMEDTEEIAVASPAIVHVEISEMLNTVIPSWVPDMEEFCEKNSITPQDLMDSYGKKPVKEKKRIEINKDLLPGDRSDGENYVANPLNRRMTEPEEGTNAFYLRYGAYTHAEAKKLKRPEVNKDLLPNK